MSKQTARNIAIILAIGLAVAFVPGGGGTAAVILGAISLAFMAAIGFLGYRLYIENRFTLWGMSTQHRALLYGGVAGATAGVGRVQAWLAAGRGASLQCG